MFNETLGTSRLCSPSRKGYKVGLIRQQTGLVEMFFEWQMGPPRTVHFNPREHEHCKVSGLSTVIRASSISTLTLLRCFSSSAAASLCCSFSRNSPSTLSWRASCARIKFTNCIKLSASSNRVVKSPANCRPRFRDSLTPRLCSLSRPVSKLLSTSFMHTKHRLRRLR